MSKYSPTQLSLKFLKEQGYTVDITEHWNPFSRTRKDLFNICDIVALRDKEIVFVQTTTAGNALARCKKIADSEAIGAIRKAGITVIVHGWFKNKSNRWECKVRDVS